MTLRRYACAGLVLSGALASPAAWAHSFGPSYTLPVPVWLYLYGAAAALVMSFMLVGYFVTSDSTRRDPGEHEPAGRPSKAWQPSRSLTGFLRGLSVGALALTILAGFFGANDSFRNINMTLFWVVFYLGFTYFTAFAGDWFAVLNPFRVLVEGAGGAVPTLVTGRWQYPARLEYWPALAFYFTFIWCELLGHTAPLSLAVLLSTYVAITFLGCWLVGTAAWFEHCEFFGVFLRLVSRIAPVSVDPEGRVVLRKPFAGLLQKQAIPASLLLFILFMLSSTAFDGLKETAVWVAAFWKHLYQWVLIPLFGDAAPVDYPAIKRIFLGWQTTVLALSPLLYMGLYALFLLSAKVVTRSRIPARTLLLSFGLCLVPIAFVYHVTHYFTLLQVQGAELVRLISDPLGIGWNIFGTAHVPANSIPNMAVVWHLQVVLIVAGHIVSVYLAHLQALKLFPDRRSAVLSQLPVLVLMMAFTALGLWILSLPLDSSPVRLD